MIANYHLGAPVWGLKDWVGELFRKRSQPGEFLQQYAGVFNTVEGNTTFWGTPSEDTVLRWRDQTPDAFRFCFKLPKIVTHDIRLREHAFVHVDAFFERMAPLGERLGPYFLQLSRHFPGADFDILEAFLRALPDHHDYALEVRHPDFYPDGPLDIPLNQLLTELKMDRVIFDTRGLRDDDRRDPIVRATQRKKPNTRWAPVATGKHPFIRYCGHRQLGLDEPYLDFWAEHLTTWIAEGRRPYMFIHTPGDFTVPRLAARFHEKLSETVRVGDLPAFPASGGQMNLF